MLSIALFHSLLFAGLTSAYKSDVLRSFDISYSNSSCPAGLPLSCSNTTVVEDLCCFESPGGVVLLAQFWDYSPGLGPEDAFTIHGLWPDNCDGTYQQFCIPSLEITDARAVLNKFGDEDLLAYMDINWKNGNVTAGDNDLWIHEYNKHGTCYSTINPSCYSNYTEGQQVADFYKLTVATHKQLPTYDWLKEANIVPSTTKNYTSSEIESALSSKFGKKVYISCDSGNNLNEIWYYHHVQGSLLDENFVRIDPVSNSTGCPATGVKYTPKIIATPGSNSTTNTTNGTVEHASLNAAVQVAGNALVYGVSGVAAAFLALL
ncbi:hypothetical protein BABINDRAFT_7313 [Babjeviella inositovora NRRL Y-12698]|uniref:ribonuclease T2 n=1 Tax=Babjeviella inositovora NRRL Y-12698 TaxID=984486 RepID=A0A1E3QSC7_9ASCO|nr:uncharacterized protein BABINDRAFT_7313 [Babjeviella inositovora NRRL Y-12698]ODQ80599.1 hypothetical protein BABINDRAFT_7313 [Babjeviella inositovora NRRL Y-12698]